MTQLQPATTDVYLWGRTLGTVTWNPSRKLGEFEYAPEFRESGLEVAPITMPLGTQTFCFPELNTQVFEGLPGFLADSLPDKFGHTILNAWLNSQPGVAGRHLNSVERLRCIGTKGMGALEYSPGIGEHSQDADVLDLRALVNFSNAVLAEPGNSTRFVGSEDLRRAMQSMMKVGISADGSRAKAVIAWNPETGEVRCGHSRAPEGYGYWLLKFDGVTGNRDKEAVDPQGYGLIEYAYHLMAVSAGIHMEECRLLHENGRRHFITRRFDRTPQGDKIHRQSLCAMAHMDFDAAGAYSYEQVMEIIQRLALPEATLEEQFRRMVFNVLARNHDDHPKNIAFLMDPRSQWRLSPAYDLTFAYNPEGQWTNQHQMSLNGKRDGFSYADFSAVASRFSLSSQRADTIIQQVAEAVSRWRHFAQEAGVAEHQINEVAVCLRLNLV